MTGSLTGRLLESWRKLGNTAPPLPPPPSPPLYDVLHQRCDTNLCVPSLPVLELKKTFRSSVRNEVFFAPPPFFLHPHPLNLTSSLPLVCVCGGGGVFALTKADSSHQAAALVVMLKESDLMSHTVIGAAGLWVFLSGRPSALIGPVCVRGGTGSRPRELGVKGEVSSWKCGARDRGEGPAARDCGSWEINVTAPSTRRELFFFFPAVEEICFSLRCSVSPSLI